MQQAELQELSMPGMMTKRGFWLYVWEITINEQQKVYYIGRTGDASSPNAASPIDRMSAHLGKNKNSNTLRKHLQIKGIDLTMCQECSLVSYGPIFDEVKDMEQHCTPRNKMAALEKALYDAMIKGGYKVLNHKISSLMELDDKLWSRVSSVFAKRFSNLHI